MNTTITTQTTQARTMSETSAKTLTETKQFKVTVEINATGKLQIVIEDKRFNKNGISVIDKYQDSYSRKNDIRICTAATIRTDAHIIRMDG